MTGLPRSARRREVVCDLEELGFRFTRRAKHALIFDHPSGARASCPGSPGDRRSDRNALSEARRALRHLNSTNN